MTLPIERGIPLPKSTAGRVPTYPLADMKVGDSFFAVGKTMTGISSAISYFRSRHKDRTFARRTVTENGVEGIRVWRVS